jgi:hypothetical protein
VACYAEPMVVNHGVLYGASGCESWRAILSQWLLIMVCIPEQVIAIHVPVVVHHGVLC